MSIEYIQSLDLDYIVKRIMRKYQCDTQIAGEAIRKYKNFLILRLHYPDHKCVPTAIIDLVWHEHILHTEKYMKDCNCMFNSYFHHHPSQHAESEKEAQVLRYKETARLYEKHFQEKYEHTFDITLWF